MTDSAARRLRARLVPWAIRTGALALRPVTMGVRAVVLDRIDRVLLVRHTYVPGWQFPGGGIEPGESARTALAREVREETRVELAGEPALLGVFLQGRRDHVVVYVARDFTVLGARAPDWEIAASSFFPVSEIPQDTTAPTRRRLREVLEGVPPAETW